MSCIIEVFTISAIKSGGYYTKLVRLPKECLHLGYRLVNDDIDAIKDLLARPTRVHTNDCLSWSTGVFLPDMQLSLLGAWTKADWEDTVFKCKYPVFKWLFCLDTGDFNEYVATDMIHTTMTGGALSWLHWLSKQTETELDPVNRQLLRENPDVELNPVPDVTDIHVKGV